MKRKTSSQSNGADAETQSVQAYLAACKAWVAQIKPPRRIRLARHSSRRRSISAIRVTPSSPKSQIKIQNSKIL
jgi:hypothetical protein